MSWMDSWSRPRKDQATPAPFYLHAAPPLYCRACGRVIGAHKSARAPAARYCSARCKGRGKPGPADRAIEAVFVRFLDGVEALPGRTRPRGLRRKGETRVLVPCDAVQESMFGRAGEEGGADAVSDGGPAPCTSVEGGETGDDGDGPGGQADPDVQKKMDKGLRTAREREMVRCAARRLVVFGTEGGDKGEGRKCEAVMNANVVEPSFAKGNWGIRWRED